MNSRLRLFAIIVAALVAVGFIAWKFIPGVGREKIIYTTAPVTKGNIVRVVTANGDLNPLINVTVGCQISGTISKLYVDYNSPVKAGQLIAEIDPPTYEANVSSAQGALAQARANLEIARLNESRTRGLRDNRVASQADYDKAKTDLMQADATILVQEAAVKRAQVDLDRCSIRAPIDGIVISRAIDVGQTVAASLNAPVLFTIANDLTKMQINAKVAEADVGGVEVGQEVTFNVDAFPQQPFAGRVIQVRNSPIIVDNVVNYDTIIEVANPDLKLKPGMTASVSIQLAKREGVLRVPNAALRFRPPEGVPVEGGNKSAVAAPGPAGPPPGGGAPGGRPAATRAPTSRTAYLAPIGGGETLRPVQVKTGITDGVFTEVLDGLKEGDLLVTAVKSGMPVASSTQTANPLTGSQPRR